MKNNSIKKTSIKTRINNIFVIVTFSNLKKLYFEKSKTFQNNFLVSKKYYFYSLVFLNTYQGHI